MEKELYVIRKCYEFICKKKLIWKEKTSRRNLEIYEMKIKTAGLIGKLHNLFINEH